MSKDNNCPVCDSTKTDSCKCLIGHSKCENSHYWSHCHGKQCLMTEDEYNNHALLKKGCKCENRVAVIDAARSVWEQKKNEHKKKYLLMFYDNHDYCEEMIYAWNAIEALVIVYDKVKGRQLDWVENLRCFEIARDIELPLEEWRIRQKEQNQQKKEKEEKEERKKMYEKLHQEFGKKK